MRESAPEGVTGGVGVGAREALPDCEEDAVVDGEMEPRTLAADDSEEAPETLPPALSVGAVGVESALVLDECEPKGLALVLTVVVGATVAVILALGLAGILGVSDELPENDVAALTERLFPAESVVLSVEELDRDARGENERDDETLGLLEERGEGDAREERLGLVLPLVQLLLLLDCKGERERVGEPVDEALKVAVCVPALDELSALLREACGDELVDAEREDEEVIEVLALTREEPESRPEASDVIEPTNVAAELWL
jgi:hypothetical protein